jgi:hypothetical protein
MSTASAYEKTHLQKVYDLTGIVAQAHCQGADVSLRVDLAATLLGFWIASCLIENAPMPDETALDIAVGLDNAHHAVVRLSALPELRKRFDTQAVACLIERLSVEHAHANRNDLPVLVGQRRVAWRAAQRRKRAHQRIDAEAWLVPDDGTSKTLRAPDPPVIKVYAGEKS